MKNEKITALFPDLVFTMLLLVLFTGRSFANALDDSLHMQRVRTFQPYVENIAWVRDLLSADPQSNRAQRMLCLTKLDEAWLHNAKYSNHIPTEWCGFWSNIVTHSIDVFPYNVFDKHLYRVTATAEYRDIILIALKTIYHTKVIAFEKSFNYDGLTCQIFELNTEKYQDPEYHQLYQRKRTMLQEIHENLYGDYVERTWLFGHSKVKATISANSILALKRKWIIKSRGEVFARGRRAYRLYTWEEKTRTPGYFLVEKYNLNKDNWYLKLELEPSALASVKNLHFFGAKYAKVTRSRFNYFRLGMGFILLGIVYWTYRRRLKSIQRERSRTELALSGLRAQLNPHFLFNSLGSIQDLMNADNKPAANRYFDEMAQLLRYVVDSSKDTYIPLSPELAALEKYCSLEALRTPFHYAFDVHPEIDQSNVEIPTMLLQPFVENAILHGLRPGTDPKELKISIWPESGNRIGISILDNGIGIDEAQRRGQKLLDTRDHQGMATTQKRIDLLNEGKKEKITLKVIDRSHLKPGQTGTLVQLSIPL